MKKQTTREMIVDIHRKIEGLTHDIKTLEVIGKKFLDTALEVRSLKEELRNTNFRMNDTFKCKFHHVECEHKCELKELIDRGDR